MYPLVFDTFDFIAPEAIDLLKKIHRVIHSNVITPRSIDVVFRRLGLLYKKV
jgi:hypothetical protein